MSPTPTESPSRSLGGFLAPKQVAHRLGLQPRAIYKAIEAGELRAFRFRNRLRISESDLTNYIDGSVV
jgi:excisionase family DNA binding protein